MPGKSAIGIKSRFSGTLGLPRLLRHSGLRPLHRYSRVVTAPASIGELTHGKFLVGDIGCDPFSFFARDRDVAAGREGKKIFIYRRERRYSYRPALDSSTSAPPCKSPVRSRRCPAFRKIVSVAAMATYAAFTIDWIPGSAVHGIAANGYRLIEATATICKGPVGS